MSRAGSLPDNVLRALPAALRPLAMSPGGPEALVAMSAMVQTGRIADEAAKDLPRRSAMLSRSIGDRHQSRARTYSGMRARPARHRDASSDASLAAALTVIGSQFVLPPPSKDIVLGTSFGLMLATRVASHAYQAQLEAAPRDPWGDLQNDKELARAYREIEDVAREEAMKRFAQSLNADVRVVTAEFWNTVRTIEKNDRAMQRLVEHVASLPRAEENWKLATDAVLWRNGFVGQIRQVASHLGQFHDGENVRFGDAILDVALDVHSVAQAHGLLVPHEKHETARRAHRRLIETDLPALERAMAARDIVMDVHGDEGFDEAIGALERLAVDVHDFAVEAVQRSHDESPRRITQMFDSALKEIEQSAWVAFTDEVSQDPDRGAPISTPTPPALLNELPRQLRALAADRQGIDALLAVRKFLEKQTVFDAHLDDEPASRSELVEWADVRQAFTDEHYAPSPFVEPWERLGIATGATEDEARTLVREAWGRQRPSLGEDPWDTVMFNITVRHVKNHEAAMDLILDYASQGRLPGDTPEHVVALV